MTKPDGDEINGANGADAGKKNLPAVPVEVPGLSVNEALRKILYSTSGLQHFERRLSLAIKDGLLSAVTAYHDERMDAFVHNEYVQHSRKQHIPLLVAVNTPNHVVHGHPSVVDNYAHLSFQTICDDFSNRQKKTFETKSKTHVPQIQTAADRDSLFSVIGNEASDPLPDFSNTVIAVLMSLITANQSASCDAFMASMGYKLINCTKLSYSDNSSVDMSARLLHQVDATTLRTMCTGNNIVLVARDKLDVEALAVLQMIVSAGSPIGQRYTHAANRRKRKNDSESQVMVMGPIGDARPSVSRLVETSVGDATIGTEAAKVHSDYVSPNITLSATLPVGSMDARAVHVLVKTGAELSMPEAYTGYVGNGDDRRLATLSCNVRSFTIAELRSALYRLLCLLHEQRGLNTNITTRLFDTAMMFTTYALSPSGVLTCAAPHPTYPGAFTCNDGYRLTCLFLSLDSNQKVTVMNSKLSFLMTGNVHRFFDYGALVFGVARSAASVAASLTNLDWASAAVSGSDASHGMCKEGFARISAWRNDLRDLSTNGWLAYVLNDLMHGLGASVNPEHMGLPGIVGGGIVTCAFEGNEWVESEFTVPPSWSHLLSTPVCPFTLRSIGVNPGAVVHRLQLVERNDAVELRKVFAKYYKRDSEDAHSLSMADNRLASDADAVDQSQPANLPRGAADYWRMWTQTLCGQSLSLPECLIDLKYLNSTTIRTTSVVVQSTNPIVTLNAAGGFNSLIALPEVSSWCAWNGKTNALRFPSFQSAEASNAAGLQLMPLIRGGIAYYCDKTREDVRVYYVPCARSSGLVAADGTSHSAQGGRMTLPPKA